MTNYEIADHFTLLSKLMDIHGENSFKIKSYTNAAFNIEKLPVEIASMDDATLFSVKGIGENIGQKIRELLNTGKLPQLENLIQSTPSGIIEMMNIKGLGPKKISVIWKELGIESIGELEYACNENRLVSLKGFGEKTQANILKIIAFLDANKGYHLWAEVEETAIAFRLFLNGAFPANNIELTGEYRRKLPALRGIELVTDADKEALKEYFINFAEGTTVEEEENLLTVLVPNQPRVLIHLSQPANFYKDLFNTTGSAEFLAAFAENYSMPAVVNSEEEIFTQNNLQFIPAVMREYGNVLEKAKAHSIPKLITTSDIRGIIHSHSKWSDGAESIETMAKAAIAQGLEYLVISDHSQIAFYANGLSPERLAAQHQEIDALNEKLKPFKIFKSIEADILNDGALDYNDRVLSTFDLVIASVHTNLKMTEEKAMARLLKAIENPYTTILGHMTGRLLLSREGYPVDHKKIIDACAANNVVIEINAHPRRLDMDWKWVEYALEKGVLLSINPDAHALSGYHDVYYGALVGQKGGLTANRNLSSFSLQQFETFIEEHKKKRGLL